VLALVLADLRVHVWVFMHVYCLLECMCLCVYWNACVGTWRDLPRASQVLGKRLQVHNAEYLAEELRRAGFVWVCASVWEGGREGGSFAIEIG